MELPYKNWPIKRRKRWNDYQREWRKKNPEKFKNYVKTWQTRNPEKYKQSLKNGVSKYTKRRRSEEKEKIFKLLGNKCSCVYLDCWHVGECSITDRRALQLDHINGGGIKDIKANGNYTRLMRYNNNPELAKKTLQILCANCNWVKRHTHNEFPHACKIRSN